MKCPFCNNENIKVIDSRPAEDNNAIRRRRQCEACGRRFTTYEKIETIPLMVVKKDDTRQAYDRAKIEAGVLLACHKRPVSTQDINRLVDEVENEIFNSEEKEITTTRIGNLVMDKLKQLDEVAYVRFSSVYREFKDVNTFLKELEKLYKGGKREL
ncbi:transcriptional regulator NrdR [Lacrimispora sp. NSJ-141]|uniref:Transcriptional repressor NrdR n=2 Tax=Lachnospiraceae TaxID=186803 RepID=A0A7G9G4A3_9FIRM|nr:MULTISPECIES: transcriptional regulator NrdR [Lachnospiraceae]MCD2491228.1 transcriptional regulator NrdR [Lientehia hominis]QNM05635.1 transcriptional repressor NrdR [Qiania dongpingensis]